MNDILNDKVEVSRIVCRYCGSGIVWKYGRNRNGIQRYKCPNCGKVLLEKDALTKMRVSIRHLGDVIGQYYGGMALKELSRHFDQQHSKSVARSSFDRWLKRFSKIAVDEASKYRPKVGDKWISDECVLRINGKNTWCWDIIDADTRFLLAMHLSPTRTTKDAQKLMEKAATVAGKAPKVVITDALRAYADGVELAFGSPLVRPLNQCLTLIRGERPQRLNLLLGFEADLCLGLASHVKRLLGLAHCLRMRGEVIKGPTIVLL